MDYCLPQGYASRNDPNYFVDDDYQGLWQPDVYPGAAALATWLGARRMVDVGCGTAGKLTALHPQFEIVGVDYGSNIETCRRRYDFGTWLEVDLDRGDTIGISDFTNSVVVCADVIEHLVHPERLLSLLSDALDRGASALVLSTPDRELNDGPDHPGPPSNPAHVREWTAVELERFMESMGLTGRFGRTRTNDVIPAIRTILAVIPGRAPQHSAVVDNWFDERLRWQRVLEEQHANFVRYETYVRELEKYNSWLLGERDAWERRAQAVETRLGWLAAVARAGERFLEPLRLVLRSIHARVRR